MRKFTKENVMDLSNVAGKIFIFCKVMRNLQKKVMELSNVAGTNL